MMLTHWKQPGGNSWKKRAIRAIPLFRSGKLYPNPANQTNTIYYFLALDVNKVSEQHLIPRKKLKWNSGLWKKSFWMAKNVELFHSLQVSALFLCIGVFKTDWLSVAVHKKVEK